MSDTSRNVPFTFDRIKEESAGMWQDFYSERRPMGKMCVYQNDFVAWVADEWTLTEVNASTQLLVDERNGILRHTTAGADNDGTQMQLGGSGDGETVGESWAPAAGKNLWFETCIRAVEDITQIDFFVGLHIQGTAVIASKGSDFIGFKSDDGDALIDSESSNTSNVSTEAGIATGAINTFYTLGFKVTGTDKAEFYVDNVLKSTITTNIPTTMMKLTIAFLNGEAAANTFDVDYVIVAQDR